MLFDEILKMDWIPWYHCGDDEPVIWAKVAHDACSDGQTRGEDDEGQHSHGDDRGSKARASIRGSHGRPQWRHRW